MCSSFYKLPEEDRQLQRPQSVLSLFLISMVSAISASLIGGGLAVLLFEKDWFTGFGFWFTTELVNDLLLVPVVLTTPPFSQWKEARQQTLQSLRNTPLIAVPLAVLLVTCIVTVFVGGAGAIAFTVPALLWCALVYSIFSTALITLLTCAWMMIAVSSGLITIHPVSTDFIRETMSLRLGIAFLALAPLTAASINQARNALVTSLNRAADFDFLTNALSRRAFLREGERVVESSSNQATVPAVMVLDLDHFKHVNDNHGHAIGDAVLVEFAKAVSNVLREHDLFGRIGGEEFAVVIAKTEPTFAERIAERIRNQVENLQVPVATGETLRFTVSVGLACGNHTRKHLLKDLLAAADQSLYRAKTTGRNRVESTVLGT